MSDRVRFACEMRKFAVNVNGVVCVSKDLWDEIASMIEGSEKVVRCMECRHRSIHPDRMTCKLTIQRVTPFDFCSNAEKMIGGHKNGK